MTNKYFFQDANSFILTSLSNLHNLILMFNITIMMLIFMVIYFIISNKTYFLTPMQFSIKQNLEIIWIILPMIIMLNMAFPSIVTLYMNENFFINILLTIKIIAHQWYWSIEYSDSNPSYNYDIFLMKECKNYLRLLDTDFRMIIPMSMNIRLIVTSMDVIHSFTIPSLGIEVDACPGRLNQINIFCTRPGIFWGQCSEICGINHSFMPVSIEVVNNKLFTMFMLSMNNLYKVFNFSIK